MDKASFPVRNEKDFQKFLVREYLKYGSVDAVYEVHRYSLPISYAQYQRVLDKWGIVKAAGPNSKLSEVINFLTNLVEDEIPLEKLYKKMPPSFLTSTVTLYRILSYIKEGITRRLGTGLILSAFNNDRKILVAEDYSTPRAEFGKAFGSLSIPMGFAKKTDLREKAILRILQNEVFMDLAIENNIPNIIPDRPKPFMYLDIADVRVEVFHLKLPEKYSSNKYFSSYKLKNFSYIDIDNLKTNINTPLRAGIKEAITGYSKYLGLLEKDIEFNPLQVKSELNYYLYEV
jgi:hypothetical protein